MKYFSRLKKRIFNYFSNHKNVLIVFIVTIIIIFILIGFPMLTNMFAVNNPPFWKVNDQNDWIGFFSSYFGAIIGGIIAGFYLGKIN